MTNTMITRATTVRELADGLRHVDIVILGAALAVLASDAQGTGAAEEYRAYSAMAKAALEFNAEKAWREYCDRSRKEVR
jgi:hypothetical protein